MLYHEIRLHTEFGAFLDGERGLLEIFDGVGAGQVNGDVGAAFDFEGERFDDAAALVFGVDVDGWGRGDAEGGFPAVEGFVVLVWEGRCQENIFTWKGKTRGNFFKDESGMFCEEMWEMGRCLYEKRGGRWEMLAREEKGSIIAGGCPYRSLEELLDIIIA